MSQVEARLAWTLFLAPRRPHGDRPAWPALLQRCFGDVDPGRVDPIEEILRGPLPVRVLARPETGKTLLSGLGDGVAITGLATAPASDDEPLPSVDDLRRRAIAALLVSSEPATDEAIEALLAELGEDPHWEVAGLVEVEAGLHEGLPEDVPEGAGWLDQGVERIHRAAGVGEGHAGFAVEAWFARHSERTVAIRRLAILCAGHGVRVPPLVEYGWSALRWGRAARSGLRRSRALESVLEEVRLAASWATTGGPVPDGLDLDLPRLAARLDTARVALQEVVEELEGRRSGVERAAARIVASGHEPSTEGPFVEASARGDEMVRTLAARVATGGRWAEALASARGIAPS